jgi:hypothetical protein
MQAAGRLNAMVKFCKRCLWLAALIAAGVVVAFGAAESVAAQPRPEANAAIREPQGYYVMQQVGAQNVSNRKLSSPKWDGIVIRERWSAVQPTRDTTDWSFIDAQVARAKRMGKKYILAIYTGNNAPPWLDVPLYKTAPLPWDETTIREHGRMVAMLGKRYADDPDLVGVELGGPTRGPSGSLEMHLADGLQNQPGYSDQRMIAAWQQCIDQYAAAFPDCALISDGGVAPGGGRANVTQAVFNYLYKQYPERAHVSHCALKANTPENALHHAVVVAMGKRGCPVGFEMIGPSVGGNDGQNGPIARFGGSFSLALQKAKRANAQWLKVYQGDERNLP